MHYVIAIEVKMCSNRYNFRPDCFLVIVIELLFKQIQIK